LPTFHNIHISSIKNIIKDKSIFIFDFDGVLVDSVEIKTDAFVFLYKEYGNEIVNKIIEHHRLNGGMSRYEKFKHYHQSFLNQKITKDEINTLDQKFSNYVVNKVVNSPEVEGASEFLNKYYKHNKCFVNSATPNIEIKKIIKLRGWTEYFEGIFGSPDDKIKNISKIFHYIDNIQSDKKNSTVFFGDAKSDFLAAKAAGIDFVLLLTSKKKLSFAKEVKFSINNFLNLI
jgi:phosphoglycolate phosphatase-like HAD superfamily hydrolase|tara:strand:- start:315 stop:1004 length:690 start_codon:yes stop_codon:yes gene_type:complete